MLRRLAGLAAAYGALPEPPFVCDNTQCRVEPRNASAAPICAAGYYTCASCCDEDAYCNCDGHGGDAYDHAWRTPKCPEGYYECGDCCDRDADCGCEYSTSDARYACDRAGSVAEGGSCDGRGQCAAGLICLRGINSDPGECRRRCEADGECGAGERCAFIDDDRSAACTGFCLPVSECSMERQDCPAGEGCYLFPDDDVAHFFCHPEGRGTEEDICPRRRSMACEPGLLCAPHYFRPSSHRCQPLCTTDADCGVLSRCTGETAGLMHCR